MTEATPPVCLVQRDAIRSSADEPAPAVSHLEAMMALISAEVTAAARRRQQAQEPENH